MLLDMCYHLESDVFVLLTLLNKVIKIIFWESCSGSETQSLNIHSIFTYLLPEVWIIWLKIKNKDWIIKLNIYLIKNWTELIVRKDINMVNNVLGQNKPWLNEIIYKRQFKKYLWYWLHHYLFSDID